MPRRKKVVPEYLLHRPSGNARVRIDGRDIYLGKYNSEESHVEYARVIAELASKIASKTTERIVVDEPDDPGPSVSEICLVFWKHAIKHYRDPDANSDGRELEESQSDEKVDIEVIPKKGSTSELFCYRSCLRILRKEKGLTPAKEFGPVALKAVRSEMIKLRWKRKNINRMICRIRHVFKHAIEEELIEPSVLHKLEAVEPLKAGRCDAEDNPDREAVDERDIEAVRSQVSPLVKDLIDLYLLVGCRPSELLVLTTAMIDQTKTTWQAELQKHKNAFRGKSRVLPFGPQAQEILKRYLLPDGNERIFKITRCGLCRAITRACDRAKIKKWTPHWLRHTYITRTREARGIEAAQAVAGHSKADMTAAYSARMTKLAAETAAAIG